VPYVLVARPGETRTPACGQSLPQTQRSGARFAYNFRHSIAGSFDRGARE
jgi:hypothetical protein